MDPRAGLRGERRKYQTKVSWQRVSGEIAGQEKTWAMVSTALEQGRLGNARRSEEWGSVTKF